MAGSSAPLRRLGAELRRLREATGRTQTDVGTAIGRTHATLVNWERGKTKISKSDLVCLLGELGANTEARLMLDRLREESAQSASRWTANGLPDWLRSLVSFEQDAVTIAPFEPLIIPALLQTEDYARALHEANPRVKTPEDVDNRVDLWMRRQQRLTGDNPVELHAVITESALKLPVGGREVMAAQCARLRELAHAGNITIQVLPMERGAVGAIAGNFTLLHFADPVADPPLGYFDGPFGGYLVNDKANITSLSTTFDDIRETALNERDSGAVLEEYQLIGH